MLEDPCARIPSNRQDHSTWLSVLLPAADERDYVDLSMDLIEGRVRYRKGKKWKTRWAVLRRVNPATEVLNLVLYPKEANAGARHKEKALLSLKGFSGLQVLNKMDKNFNIIVIITTDNVIPLSFETIDQRAEWLALLQGHYGKEKSFQGIVPHKQKIKSGEADLRFYSTFFSLTKKDSYRLIGQWKLTSLPKYGAVEGGFAFQAGPESATGDKSVIYFFATRSGKEIQALFDSVCRAGEAMLPQESYTETTQPSTSKGESQSQPNFLKRAWLRMSAKRRKGGRQRSRSVPSPTRGKNRAETGEQTSPPENGQTTMRRNVSVPAYFGASSSNEPGLNEVFEEEKPKSPLPGYENIAGVTPEGYHVMMPADNQVRRSRSSSGARSPTRRESEERGVRTSEKIDEGGEGEVEGYVVVEGRDEELLEKVRADSEAASQRRTSRGSENGRVKSSSSASEKREENGVIAEEAEGEQQERKPSETEQHSNGDVQCQIVVTSTDDTEEKKSAEKESIVNDERDAPKKQEMKSDVHSNGSNASEKVVTSVDYVNGDIFEKKENYMKNSTSTSVSSRRGMKAPPKLNLPSMSTAGSAEHLYVNSPKIVDYVNVKGSKPGGLRSRSVTGSQAGNRSKLNPYAMYDGNDDSIYHSVESLMPSHPGYLNVFTDDPSRSHSFENIAGHSYANVAGAQPSYKNIGHFDRSYVNVMSRPPQGNLNYVRVAGVDSSHASSPLLITSTSPKSSDYTWIDERKTKLLLDTGKMHSERRQENLPRIMKK